MSVVSGLIDTNRFFKFKKLVIPTNGTNNMAGEVDPIVDPHNAPPPLRKCRNYYATNINNHLRVQGNPAQNLKNDNVIGYYNGAGGNINTQALPVTINNGDPLNNNIKIANYIEKMNNTPPLRMYNGVEFRLPAGFITR
jgi:hypothetical protein